MAEAASVTTGRVFRAVSWHGTLWGTGISENVVWYIVRSWAGRLELDHLAPHDLRRTCAKLCHVNGSELEQTQFPRACLRADHRVLPELQAELGGARGTTVSAACSQEMLNRDEACCRQSRSSTEDYSTCEQRVRRRNRAVAVAKYYLAC